MLTERQKLLMEYLVEAYIKTGEPVGSSCLKKRCQLDIASSTIRSDLNRLESMKYLEQLHTSSGRVPTDIGVRFYIDHFMPIESISDDVYHSFDLQFKLSCLEKNGFFSILTFLGTLFSQGVFFVLLPKRDSYSLGYSERLLFGDFSILLQFPLLSQPAVLSSLMNFESNKIGLYDFLTEDFFKSYCSKDVSFFIGSENKVDWLHSMSLLLCPFLMEANDNGCVGFFGPKHLNYSFSRTFLLHLSKTVHAFLVSQSAVNSKKEYHYG